MRKTKRAMGNELNSEVGMRNAENKKRRKAQGKKITTEGHGKARKKQYIKKLFFVSRRQVV
jgi:hypothetical protein